MFLMLENLGELVISSLLFNKTLKIPIDNIGLIIFLPFYKYDVQANVPTPVYN